MPAHACFPICPPVVVTGAGAACALGKDLASCLHGVDQGVSGLRPIAELMPEGDAPSSLLAGWIQDRALLRGRRHGAASNVAVHVAREAVTTAGWTEAEREQAWLWVGTSRGNAGEWTGAWKERRPVRKFAAANSMHSEVATAVSLQLGLSGPWQVLSNGCASGLDALGWAAQSVAAGWTKRALAVAVDLPLVPALMEDFFSTGLLSTTGVNDPYHPETKGFFPGEGAAAVTVEARSDAPWCKIHAYGAGNDACNALALPPDGRPLKDLVTEVLAPLGGVKKVMAVCPHATGTAIHRVSETDALHAIFGEQRPSLHVLKPFTGHTLGASGLLDSALLAGFLRDKRLPGNVSGITPPSASWPLPTGAGNQALDGLMLKIAAGMGGHNAVLALAAL